MLWAFDLSLSKNHWNGRLLDWHWTHGQFKTSSFLII